MTQLIVGLVGNRVQVQAVKSCGRGRVIDTMTRSAARQLAFALIRVPELCDFTPQQCRKLAWDLFEAAHAARRAPRTVEVNCG